MTRDEAAEILADNVFPGEVHEAAVMKDARGFINAYVALGMLKLNMTYPNGDPLPAGKVGRVIGFMNDAGLSHLSPGELEGKLSAAGLKIVEA